MVKSKVTHCALCLTFHQSDDIIANFPIRIRFSFNYYEPNTHTHIVNCVKTSKYTLQCAARRLYRPAGPEPQPKGYQRAHFVCACVCESVCVSQTKACCLRKHDAAYKTTRPLIVISTNTHTHTHWVQMPKANARSRTSPSDGRGITRAVSYLWPRRRNTFRIVYIRRPKESGAHVGMAPENPWCSNIILSRSLYSAT